jgi:hypothetical protein
MQYLPAKSSVWRRATFLHCYDVMEFRSKFWCSRNCSSTMRTFPGSALRVIWYFYHTADRHPRSCDISCIFAYFFHKNTHRVGDFIPTQNNSLSTLCVILEEFAHIFFEGFARIFLGKLLCLSDGSMHVGYMIKRLLAMVSSQHRGLSTMLAGMNTESKYCYHDEFVSGEYLCHPVGWLVG